MSEDAVGTIDRHARLRAGIEAPTTRAHQFRHGLATEVLRQGASLAQIGELVGGHQIEAAAGGNRQNSNCCIDRMTTCNETADEGFGK